MRTSALLVAFLLAAMPLGGGPSKHKIKSNPVLVVCNVNVPWLERRVDHVGVTLCQTVLTTLAKRLPYWRFVSLPQQATKAEPRIEVSFVAAERKVTASLAYVGIAVEKDPLPKDLLTPADYVGGKLPEAVPARDKMVAGIETTLFNTEHLNALEAGLKKVPLGHAAWYDTSASQLVIPVQFGDAIESQACRVSVAVAPTNAKRMILSRSLRPPRTTPDVNDDGGKLIDTAVITVAECVEEDGSKPQPASKFGDLTTWSPGAVYLRERVDASSTLEQKCEALPRR